MKKVPAELQFLEQIEIIDIAEEGKGVGKYQDLVIFVEKTVPGDVVNIQIHRLKKNLAEAKITAFVKHSPDRTEPFCAHFGTCGGCKWQHLSPEAQLRYKQKTVLSALERLGKVDIAGAEPILGSEKTQYYRNKLEFTFSNKRWLDEADMAHRDSLSMDALGFHVPGRFDKILSIEHCYLQGEPSNAIRNAVRDYTQAHGLSYYDLREHSGAMRNLIIRTSSTGELMVIVVFAHADETQINGLMDHLKAQFPDITSLLYIVNQKRNDTIFDQDLVCFAGRDHIFEEMEGLKFKIGAKSFYQTNSAQAYELYKITRNMAGLNANDLVYDLYTGAGTIANFVARQVKKVVGIEYVPSAIEDAKINSEINGIENTTFYAGDMKDILTPEFIKTHGKPDVVITDPPRAGMHADVVARLLEMEASKIVYVSCNAATQARDIALLQEKYEVKRIRPVDMFPQTQHVENIALLVLKK